MDLNLLVIHFTDINWILFALVFGMAAAYISLPPMVGFLAAGFVLSSLGMQSGDILNAVADIGVTILLFSIGLKLHVKDLFRTEIWATSVIHLTSIVVIFGMIIFALSFSGIQVFMDLTIADSILIAFALSFSSTVFAVKVLEEKAEMSSLHGKVTIGILIMQDIFAVIFLTIASGKVPSVWAVLLLLLIPLKPLIIKLLCWIGRGELLILSGMLLALGGSHLFDLVGIKPGLGALLLGILLAGNEKSESLAKSLLAFKEIFLIAFFLSIGFNGIPSLTGLIIAFILAILMLGKSFLFFSLLTKFKLRARTSFLTSLSLSNYSEFGLIVGAMGVANGWMSGEWLVIIALALSITFTFSSIANSKSHTLYAKFEHSLFKFECPQRLAGDKPIDVGSAQMLIFGMGRVGTSTYDTLLAQYGKNILGIDYDQEVIKSHLQAGRNAIVGDATDYDFWERFNSSSIRLILLDLPNIKEALDAANMIKATNYNGFIAATVKHDNNIALLEEAGVNFVFNIYAEAGSGFAHHVHKKICSVEE